MTYEEAKYASFCEELDRLGFANIVSEIEKDAAWGKAIKTFFRGGAKAVKPAPAKRVVKSVMDPSTLTKTTIKSKYGLTDDAKKLLKSGKKGNLQYGPGGYRGLGEGAGAFAKTGSMKKEALGAVGKAGLRHALGLNKKVVTPIVRPSSISSALNKGTSATKKNTARTLKDKFAFEKRLRQAKDNIKDNPYV